MNFQTTKADIPFMKMIRQDVQLNYNPYHNMKAQEYERYGRYYFASWNEDDNFEKSKSIEELPIDEDFDVTIRIMVKQLGFSSSNENIHITVDCNYNKINTSLWFCKNKKALSRHSEFKLKEEYAKAF